MKNIERQIQKIQDRDYFHKMLDQLDEDGIAMFITARKGESGHPEFQLKSFGDGYESEYLSLLAYAQTICFREYFTDEEPDDD